MSAVDLRGRPIVAPGALKVERTIRTNTIADCRQEKYNDNFCRPLFTHLSSLFFDFLPYATNIHAVSLVAIPADGAGRTGEVQSDADIAGGFRRRPENATDVQKIKRTTSETVTDCRQEKSKHFR